jgi:hypothetical protein
VLRARTRTLVGFDKVGFVDVLVLAGRFRGSGMIGFGRTGGCVRELKRNS